MSISYHGTVDSISWFETSFLDILVGCGSVVRWLLAVPGTSPMCVTANPPTQSETPAAAAEPTPGFQNLTSAAGIVLLFATLSILFIPFLGNYKVSYRSQEPMSLALALPHLLIIALISTGMRRLGDALAILVGIPLLFAFGLMAMLSGLGGDPRIDPVTVQLAFFQLAMALAAGSDLAQNKKLALPVSGVNRLIGLSVPVAVAFAMSVLTHANVRSFKNELRTQEDSVRINARIRAAAWLNAPKIDEVVRLARCIEQFRGDSIAGRAPRSLKELYEWSKAKGTEPTACGNNMYEAGYRSGHTLVGVQPPLDTLPHPYWEDTHHVVYYEPPKNLRGDPFHRAAFTLGIEAVWDSTEFPNATGQPGARSYFLDANGDVHVTAEHRRATSADPIVPVCAPGERDRPRVRECHEGFESRQRWGLVNELPRFTVSVGSLDSQGSVVADVAFQQVNALDSVRYVSIDWDDKRPPTRIDVEPSKSIIHYEMVGKDRYIHDFHPQVRHRYRDSGDKIVRAKLVTRVGAEYLASDTVSVGEFDTKSR
jgi:hypothetical protein